LAAALIVKQKGLNTRLAKGALVGVHSWGGDGDGDGDGGDGGDGGGDINNANELPRQSAEHKPYLDYYQKIGINSEFYWFTIAAADAD